MDGLRALLAVLVLVALVYALPELSSVVLPFLVAVLLALAVYPAVAWLERRGIPYVLGCALAILGILGFAFLFGWAIVAGIEHFLDRLPAIGPKFDALWKQFAERFHLSLDAAAAMAGVLADAAQWIFDFAFQFALVFFYLIFLLALRPRLDSMLEAAGGPGWRERGMRLVVAMEEQMVRYLGLTTLIAAAAGLATWGILEAYGVEGALLWGGLAFLGHFVPYVGPVVAMVPPAVMMWIQSGSILDVAEITAWAGAWNLFLGYFVAPRIFGRGLGLNEVAVLLGLAVGSWMWGVVGAMVAVPLLVLSRIALRETPLRAAAELLGPFPVKPPER